MNKYTTKNNIEKLLGVKVEEKDGLFYHGGYLDLEGTQITSLPDNLSVGGSLDLRGTQITSLPDNLSVGGSLYLRGTQITSLPDNLSVGGYLISQEIGSRKDKTSYHIKSDTVHCGCFIGTLIDFKEKVYDTYPNGIFREEYDKFIEEAIELRNKYMNKKEIA
jgi:hypothetical protein